VSLWTKAYVSNNGSSRNSMYSWEQVDWCLYLEEVFSSPLGRLNHS
jgi:hypothetical protein